jgi:hypothetical protein
MSPVLVNPYLSFGGGGGPVDLTEPWGEVSRQETIVGGTLTVGGLDLSGLQVVRLLVNGVTVTTDDATVLLRYIVAGSEISSGYRWCVARYATGLDSALASASDSSIALTSNVATQGVGNAATEGFSAVVTVYHPTSTLHKNCAFRSSWSKPDGTLITAASGSGGLTDSGAITGFVLLGSSNLTAGNVIVLGVE